MNRRNADDDDNIFFLIMVTARTLVRMMVVMVMLQVRSLPEDKQEDFFQLSIARFIVFENKHFDIEEKQSMNRPAICTKDRTESMMMGIFQTNSITIRCILRSDLIIQGWG